MTDRSRPDEEREWLSQEEDEERREERDRRSDELREAWLRHHPSEEQEGKDWPKSRYPD